VTMDYHYRWYWMLRPVRGRWGLAFDRWCVRTLGISAILGQVSLGRHLPYSPALLLTTIGVRSGELRQSVLPYVRHGDVLLIFGSNDGGPSHPAWVANLRANPTAWITVARKQARVDVRFIDGADRADLMRVLRSRRPHVDSYETASAEHGRTIALIALVPRT
jgi:deazaflavin-dependent oxidoreductase (nitroreductase family)